MSDDYEDGDPTIVLDNLIRFVDHNKDFRRDFIDDCYDFREKHGYLSENQLDVLTSIYYNYKVEEFFS